MESPPNNSAGAAIVAVPVPVLQQEGTYIYISIRGVLSADDCTVFGLSMEERLALQKRFTFSSIEVCHGVVIKSNVFQVGDDTHATCPYLYSSKNTSLPGDELVESIGIQSGVQ